MATAIEFNNISKIYRLGLVSTGTLVNDIHRWWTMNIRGKEDPYLTIGETNDRSTKGESDYVWALRDIDFKVEQGDVVGIIGKNGAGKSTLLKILSKVTAPTTGTIRARGRIGSLLEVGTGFHPEMTGRENIYMNGAILGMTKAEITKKLDEIVDFSGCERYIDTPVKRYSSGMMVRLGFAVAAHLNPEILVVDEVLAVGDAEFQKKALGKMQNVSHGEGRTVLFVSHNMTSVKHLCHKGIVLEKGSIDFSGNVDDAINKYLKLIESPQKTIIRNIPNKDKGDNDRYKREIEIVEAQLLNENPSEIANNEPLLFELTLKRNDSKIEMVQVCTSFENEEDLRVTYHVSKSIPISKPKTKVQLNIRKHNLTPGKYYARLEVGIRDFSRGGFCFNYDAINRALSFNVKYIHQEKKDEFTLWNNLWGRTYHDDDSIEIKTID